MRRVSSNLTIILKIFLPIFWTTFFGAFAVAIALSESNFIAGYPAIYVKVGAVSFVLIGVAFMFFTVMKLKRVEMGKEEVYITNYVRHIRIQYPQIARIREQNLGLFQLVTMYFNPPLSFGKKIHFLATSRRLQQFLEEHPSISEYLLKLGPEYED